MKKIKTITVNGESYALDTPDLQEVADIREAVVGEHPQSLLTKQTGYLTADDTYVGTTYRSISTLKIPCKEGDIFIYKGAGYAQAVAWIFYNDDTIVSTGQSSNATTQREVTVPSGVNYVKFSSFASTGEPILKVQKKETLQREKALTFAETFGDMDAQMAIYNAKEEVGYYTSDGNVYNVDGYHCMVTEKIPCQQGDEFIYNGNGTASAYSWFFYNDNTLVDRGQYSGETTVVIPSGVNYVKFSSYTTKANTIRWGLWKKTAPQVKKLYELIDEVNQSNVLYGKKYVAAGDSFTYGAFDSAADENGLTGKNSPVFYDSSKKMYKTYPWWIAQRNNMTVINDGISGSTMALTNDYLNKTQEITYRSPYSYERYKNVPEDADYLTIWFGINDSGTTTLGAEGDTENKSFYGAYNVVLEWLLTNRPALKIGLIVTTGAKPDYRQAVRNIGKRWGIPVLDLMGEETPALFGKESGLCDTAKQIYGKRFRISDSNAHPNMLAYENMSTYIEAFLRRL